LGIKANQEFTIEIFAKKKIKKIDQNDDDNEKEGPLKLRKYYKHLDYD